MNTALQVCSPWPGMHGHLPHDIHSLMVVNSRTGHVADAVRVLSSAARNSGSSAAAAGRRAPHACRCMTESQPRMVGQPVVSCDATFGCPGRCGATVCDPTAVNVEILINAATAALPGQNSSHKTCLGHFNERISHLRPLKPRPDKVLTRSGRRS